MWDADTGRLLQSFDAEAEALAVTFSPDGRLLAAGTVEGLALVWQVRASDEEEVD